MAARDGATVGTARVGHACLDRGGVAVKMDKDTWLDFMRDMKVMYAELEWFMTTDGQEVSSVWAVWR